MFFSEGTYTPRAIHIYKNSENSVKKLRMDHIYPELNDAAMRPVNLEKKKNNSITNYLILNLSLH